MSIFYELRGIARVCAAAKPLSVADDMFHQLLHDAIDAIFADKSLLAVKFLGVSSEHPVPDDAHLKKLIQVQLSALSEKSKMYGLQDNVYALKKKKAVDQVMGVFSNML